MTEWDSAYGSARDPDADRQDNILKPKRLVGSRYDAVSQSDASEFFRMLMLPETLANESFSRC